MKKLLTSTATAGVAVLALAAPALAQDAGTTYEADLTELNSDGGSGTASAVISDDGTQATVTVTASNLELDFAHAMHFHGVADGEGFAASMCPDTTADDANGDGVLTVAEGAPSYGGVVLSLTTEGDTSPDSALAVERYPAGTSIDYTRTIDLPENLQGEVGNLHVVVHATDTDDSGDETADLASSLNPDLPVDATAPALCGSFAVSSTGAVQTGGGALATADDGGLGIAALTAGGVLAIAGAAALRRRGEQA